MKENKLSLYFNMFLGAVGSVTILLFLAIYTLNEENSFGYLGFLGVLLVIIYINYLEKIAGINTKLIWVKAGFSMVLLISLSAIFYL